MNKETIRIKIENKDLCEEIVRYGILTYSENSQKFEGGKWNNNHYHIYRHNQKFYKIEIKYDLNENQIVLTSCYEVQPIIESHVVYKRI